MIAASSRFDAPSAKSDLTSRSRDTVGSPASIFATRDRLSLPVNHRYVEEDDRRTQSVVVGVAFCDVSERERPAATLERTTTRTTDRRAGIRNSLWNFLSDEVG
jgi:hypothetical protein